MKLIKEHINFERGKNPIKTMNIGNDVYIQSQIWGGFNGEKGAVFIRNSQIIIKDLIYYKDYPILTFFDSHDNTYTAVTLYNIYTAHGGWFSDKNYSINKIHNNIDEYIANGHKLDIHIYPSFLESVNFERGKSPLDAMEIGSKALIIKKYSNKFGNEVAEAYLLLKPYLEKSGFILETEDLIPPIQLTFKNKKGDEIEIHQKETIRDGINGCRADLRLVNKPSYFFKPGYTRFDNGDIVNLVNIWDELFSVNESLNFNRGQDPLDAMDIGNKRQRINNAMIKETDKLAKEYDFRIFVDNRDPREIHIELKHIHIKFVIKYIADNNPSFYKEKDAFLISQSCHSKMIHFVYRKTFEEALLVLKRWIKVYIKKGDVKPFTNKLKNGEKYLFNLKESINFERGKDPIDAMNIGKKTLPISKGDIFKVWNNIQKKYQDVKAKEDEKISYSGSDIYRVILIELDTRHKNWRIIHKNTDWWVSYNDKKERWDLFPEFED